MEYFSTLIVRASSAQTSFSMEYPQNIWLDEAAHGTRRYLFRIRAQCGIRQSGSKRSSWARARHQQRHWHYFEMAERVAYLFIFLCFALARQHIPFRAEKRSMNFDCKKWLSNWWHGKSWWTCEQQARALANHTGFNPRLRQHFNRTWEHHCRLLKQRWRAHTMPKTTSHDENMIIWIN